MGNMLDNMIQTTISDEQRSQIFIAEDVLTNVLAAMTVFILGLAQNIGIKIIFAYIDLILLMFMVCLFLEIMIFKHKKKASNSNADD